MIAGSVRCPAPPPVLGPLNISENPESLSSASGTYGKSGLRSTESGGNYYNAIDVTPNVTGLPDGSNIGLVGSVFVVGAPSGSTIADLKTSVDTPGNLGFILIYANKDLDVAGGPSKPDVSGCANFNFCSGSYYAYFNGTWQKLTSSKTRFLIGQELALEAQVNTTPLSPHKTAPPTKPTFVVYFYKGLGSRNWNNYSYVYDYYASISPDITALVQPSHHP